LLPAGSTSWRRQPSSREWSKRSLATPTSNCSAPALCTGQSGVNGLSQVYQVLLGANGAEQRNTKCVSLFLPCS
jgi:hypothetical protein